MNNLISQIEITNFRSIKYEKIDCSAYNLFCGQNDVGKSNILKALNLFLIRKLTLKLRLIFLRIITNMLWQKHNPPRKRNN